MGEKACAARVLTKAIFGGRAIAPSWTCHRSRRGTSPRATIAWHDAEPRARPRWSFTRSVADWPLSLAALCR